MKIHLSAALTFLFTGMAAAQTEPAGITVWGGLGTEAVIAPGLSLGLSAPVGQLANVNVAVRGSVAAHVIPLADPPSGAVPLIHADVLFSGPERQVNLYGGPGVSNLAGSFWLFGLTAGVRGEFGASKFGWFGEARVRTDFVNVSALPGVNVGLTYRF